MEIVDKKPSPESEIKIAVIAGKLQLTGSLDTKGVDISASISVDSDYFLDELAKLIPGAIDDAVIAVIKTALKAL